MSYVNLKHDKHDLEEDLQNAMSYMKLRFALDESRRIPDSEMCICGGDSPFDLELQSV